MAKRPDKTRLDRGRAEVGRMGYEKARLVGGVGRIGPAVLKGHADRGAGLRGGDADQRGPGSDKEDSTRLRDHGDLCGRELRRLGRKVHFGCGGDVWRSSSDVGLQKAGHHGAEHGRGRADCVGGWSSSGTVYQGALGGARGDRVHGALQRQPGGADSGDRAGWILAHPPPTD